MQCWSCNPQDRPQFKSLVPKLSHVLETEAGYLELSSSSFCWKDYPEKPLPDTLPVTDRDDGETK